MNTQTLDGSAEGNDPLRSRMCADVETGAAVSPSDPPPAFAAAAAAVPELPRLLLSDDDRRQYFFCKQQMKDTLDGVITFSLAFSAVRDKKLYLVEYDTIEEFCEVELKMKVRQAYRLFSHFETLKALNMPPGQEGEFVSNWTQFTIQATESQTRPFLGLPLEFRRDAWLEATSTAPHGKMTARHGAEIVRKWQRRLGMPVSAAPSEKPIGSTRPRPMVELPTGNRDEQIRQAADQAFAEVRRLSDLIGTADSSEAANVMVALELLQRLKDHLERVERMHEERPA